VQDLKFGTVFTDHMFHVEHAAGQGWTRPAIKPFGYLQIHPASQVRPCRLQLRWEAGILGM
jgi:branched-chain amino acid aminotransferase